MRSVIKSAIKILKTYLQLLVAVVTCFVMEFVKEADSKKDKTVLRPADKKNSRKNKIIYWDEPRIQNRINKAVYFNTG